MKLPAWLGPSVSGQIAAIHRRRTEFASLADGDLRERFHRTEDLLEAMAVVAEVARRVVQLEMFDVQLQGALSLARGRIAEMQTGEGKTLACTPAVAWYARGGKGVHVMTVNDYLARRDAHWMGGIYEFLGFTVGCIQQTMSPAERRNAYRCDITYATANEIGFDFLRDGIALTPGEQAHRAFDAAVIDEVDSILIDEARIPLILAGGEVDEEIIARRVDPVVRHFLLGLDYRLDEYGRNISLAEKGIRDLEAALGCGNLYEERNLALYTAIHNAIHANFLLHKDVDYVVKDGVIESVDQFKGRIVQDRRWPAGLHTAIEAKEGVPFRREGRVLGSMTLQNLVALYPQICGMTGTAATQELEFRTCYQLEVDVIPTHRPVIRRDEPDEIYETRLEKEQVVVEEIRTVHATGQPILVGTASVEESERLSAFLRDVPHSVLNARNEEAEAGIVALAGQRGAVTISTNMAGRGVDIQLGPGVAELGGLYVIGTNRHESRRIDNQLRGRAGRQGDPGRSRFFISFQDDLLVRHGINNPKYQYDVEGVQRLVEGQNLDIRQFLVKYEAVIEGQRQRIQERRQAILLSDLPRLERLVSLTTIDDLWSDHLAAVTELRAGVHWYSWGSRDPLHEYLTRVDTMYRALEDGLDAAIAERLAEAEANGIDPSQRGATWTYLTTDRPFGNYTERILSGMVRKMGKRELWG
ncbi:Protein translocase subunit SecA 2 [Candidatus Sulfopaludibacter sp. SbA3]|nr:Protein translocase subunit SecA 2 [Candidatus Sulfopaludibacter sp. SbA3]